MKSYIITMLDNKKSVESTDRCIESGKKFGYNNIEIFKVTSGVKKTENALKLLAKALYNLKRKKYIKNRLTCQTRFGFCEFYKTQHCK